LIKDVHEIYHAILTGENIVFLVITPKDKPQEYLQTVRRIILTLKELSLEGELNHSLLRNILVG
jgi:hypothetical protein